MEANNTQPINPTKKLPWSTPKIHNLNHEQSIEGKANYSTTESTTMSPYAPS